jgi:hypothetical protein
MAPEIRNMAHELRSPQQLQLPAQVFQKTLVYILALDIAKLPMFFRHCCPNVIEGTSRN